MKLSAYDCTITSGTQPEKKYDNNGKGRELQFDDKVSYKYILSIS